MGKPATDLCPGDIILVDGVPVDIVSVYHWEKSVSARLSDDPDDYKCWPRDVIVNVIGHFAPVIHV